ncbi:MAG: intradiol ring-cleavage dioxygenase [Humibacillus sp.]|nr:intradiol ring-cleavage dioxygenase [Humibacillus sp.]MDN5775670.1 intradiol ring-cleavage dioxygenase [Humibacillus sp.]
MTRHATTRSTPDTPDLTGLSYEGRMLPRPDDEVVDQGLAFDIGTLFGRRRALQVLGVGLAGGALAACGSASSGSGSTATDSATSTSASASSTTSSTGGLTEIPNETAGPFPGDGSNGADVLEQSGVVRQDIRSSFGDTSATAEGAPMNLTLTVLDIAGGGGPMAGVAVYAWQCNAQGEYSMYSDAIKNENYLRGVQVADESGIVTFKSIVPGCYSGRWPHVHFEVYPDQASITDSTKAIATSQVAIPKTTCESVYSLDAYAGSTANFSSITLTSDNVFGDDGGVHQLPTVTGDATGGFTAALTVPVDTTTTPTAGAAPAGGRGGGGGRGGPPPSGAPTN